MFSAVGLVVDHLDRGARGAAGSGPPSADADPFAQSSTMRMPRGVDRASRAPRGGRRSAPTRSRASTIVAERPPGPRRPAPRERQISCSSSSSTASSSLSPSASRTLRPLSSAGLCEAETMIPAASSPSAARKASAGVGTTPTRGRRRRGSSRPRRSRPRTCRRSGACPVRRRSSRRRPRADAPWRGRAQTRSWA